MSIANVVPATVPYPRAVQPKRWSVAEFHALYGQKQHEGRKLILVEGEILELL
jgi:hypothetical protein